MSRLTKENVTSSLRRSSSNESLEKKKPFSRPFSKSRLDNPAGRSVRMASPAPVETAALLRQNQELRQRLQEEASNYRRRLDTYKQAQQNQANLVGRLQSKVMQYKQRCSDLEGQVHETLPPVPSYSSRSTHQPTSMAAIPLPPPAGHSATSAPLSLPCPVPCDQPSPPMHSYHHENGEELSRRFEEEHLRCEQLLAQNNLLRQQLEESHRTNEMLTTDLQKLTTDWEALRDDMLAKEGEWKEEEQAFNDYYNNEHTRLLRMWREVVAVKRNFKDMQTSMKTDLNKMRYEMMGINREVSSACSGVTVNLKQASRYEEANQMQIERDNMDLKSQMASLKVQYETSKIELEQRDQKMQQLMHELKTLEDRCMHAENQAAQAQRLNDEIERLQHALRDIAHAVVQDADASNDVETVANHMHLSQGAQLPPRSPKRGGCRTSQAFAEGTISAVQAALHKYQLSIHDLQVKLQSNNDALSITKKQLESTENTRDILTSKLTEMTEKMDGTNYQLSELCKERDSLQKTLEGMRMDKHTMERGKAELNSMVDSLNCDYEKLQNHTSKMQKLIDSLDEEKKILELEMQRSMKDKEILEMNLRAEEERTSRLREETITLREELNKVYLSRDLLEQQRMEAESLLALTEKQKADLEYEFEKLSLEKVELSERLDKSSNSGDNLSQEVKQLKGVIGELEEERNKFKTLSSELGVDVASLKKELISAEQVRLDLESEKLSISEKLKFLEIDKDKVEQELIQVTRERGDVANQLTVITRKKEGLGEELMRLRQRMEQSNETNSRLNRNLEDLVKENEEKMVVIEGQEKELQRMQEQLASLRSEKEALEAVLFDTNTTLEATEVKKEQLEHEVQDLLIKQESMRNQIARLVKDFENSERRAQEMKIQLTNAAANQEAEFLQKIANLKAMAEENAKKLNEEKEQIRASLEKRMQSSLLALQASKDAEIEALKERYDQLQMHVEALCQQHEEVMIRAENDKQQALMLAHRDKQAVIERLDAVSRDLAAENDTCERLRREGAARAEKDRATINQLREEITRLKAKMEESRQKHEEDLHKLESYLSSLREEREAAQKENEELRVQIRLCEDRGDSLNNQLIETVRKLKETENAVEAARKELTDTRRALADSNIEKDKYANTNRDLRDHVKRVEGQRREATRMHEEALQKIAGLEEARTANEVEKTRLATLLKETDNNVAKLNQELQQAQNNLQKMASNASQKDVVEKELHARLTNEMEEKERIQAELHQAKKQLADLDANLHATRQELGRSRCKLNQDEHRWHGREQELLQRLDEGRCREKRLEDQKHNLEVCLADATQQIQELKARLGGCEGRVRALDEQLIQTESAKREVENRLSSIAHTLRRIAGIQLDGTVSLPYRLLSPSRRYSPARGGHDYDCRSVAGDGPIIDVDPEMVRKGVRTLMQQVAQIEREKDDFKAQLATARKQLQEGAEAQAKGENKISKLQQVLRSVQEEKANVEAKLNQKGSALQVVEENLRQKIEEVNMLREKVNSLEVSLASSAEERAQCEERLEKCRQSVSRLESEKRHLQEELTRCENRASKLDLQRVALEGDIQRLQMALHEKENNLRSLQERFENQGRASTQLEDRCIALKTTVDQLKERLQSAAITETELRAEINCLHKAHSEQGHNVLAGHDKLKQIQKTLSNSENERRILAERLEAAQSVSNDLRRTQQAQQDSCQRFQEQVAELEVQKSALESQLRIAKWNQENADQMSATVPSTADGDALRQMQRERSELRVKVDTLNEKVRTLENEKRNMERSSKFSGQVQFDRSEKSLYDGGRGELDSNRLETDTSMSRGGHGALSSSFNCGLDHTLIEQENRDLRMKCRRLETLLAEKESELARAKAKMAEIPKCMSSDAEKYRSAQLQAERLLDAREQSHRQQVLRLENQISMLREQLAQEAKRRQHYILRSTRAGREMQQLRQTLGDSLRHVAQEPLDPMTLESETRRLDSAVSLSLPPNSGREYEHHSGYSPRYK
ncbi:rootletin isoform X1 [Phlebotomus argentipes]|uniref:rootletin isoform X1 n=2 Tax=Phlebotomus argentipes TaxID=94469 RepID=UPI0028930232|nr:rootletin isoform X1 [Phlebotomus argentipes]